MARTVQNVLDIMRLVIGRNNTKDPDATNAVLLRYFNDVYELTMSDDVKLFEQYTTATVSLPSTSTDGIVDFPKDELVNLEMEAFISFTTPLNGSLSWNKLYIYQNPDEFYAYWGINNLDTLTVGFPTEVLYYDSQLVFRTIPDDNDYTINFYGYRKNTSITADDDIYYDYWMRYLAYAAALNYARDYRFDQETIANIEQGYMREKKLVYIRTHNQVKHNRSLPKW